jgi:phage tail-like protein
VAILELPKLLIESVAAIASPRRLTVVNRDPGPGETDVPSSSAVFLELVDTGSDGVDRNATRVWLSGILAFDGASSLEPQPGFDGPRSWVNETADTLRLALDPAIPFASEAVVEVRVQSATLGAAEALSALYSFTVEDRTAPQVLAAQAVEPKTVLLCFNEDVLIKHPTQFDFVSLEAPAVPVRPIFAEAVGTVVRIFLDTEMTPDVRYAVQVRGVTDHSDNVASPPFDRAVFTGYRPRHPVSRCFDLWSMLPKHNRRDDATGDLRKIVRCLQEVTELILSDIDRFPDLFDIERAPESFLDAILRDLGNPFSFELDALGKRRLASVLLDIFHQKGTAVGIRNAIRFFLGLEVSAVTPFTGTTLVLGDSSLGVDFELGPSDRFSRYAFDVLVDRILTDTQRRRLRAIVDYMRPAHTHFVDLIEPTPAPATDDWVLGVSTLGWNTALL